MSLYSKSENDKNWQWHKPEHQVRVKSCTKSKITLPWRMLGYTLPTRLIVLIHAPTCIAPMALSAGWSSSLGYPEIHSSQRLLCSSCSHWFMRLWDVNWTSNRKSLLKAYWKNKCAKNSSAPYSLNPTCQLNPNDSAPMSWGKGFTSVPKDTNTGNNFGILRGDAGIKSWQIARVGNPDLKMLRFLPSQPNAALPAMKQGAACAAPSSTFSTRFSEDL